MSDENTEGSELYHEFMTTDRLNVGGMPRHIILRTQQEAIGCWIGGSHSVRCSGL
jgi:hypothetical protein